MTVGYRRCASIAINRLTSEAQLITKRTDLNHITGRIEENNVHVLELNVSPMFDLMKLVVPNVYSTQPTMTFSSSKINKKH